MIAIHAPPNAIRGEFSGRQTANGDDTVRFVHAAHKAVLLPGNVEDAPESKAGFRPAGQHSFGASK
jgi:hypothetical protein